ncbi:MAG TPA: amidohydrolase, partial [Blastocatellia bacterium]|nr:amidohydrolase [Blastocatellia bacterium]
DLKGKTVIPGLTDAHCHLAGIGQREMTLNLEGTVSLNDFLAKVKARVDKAKPGEWVIGRGWIETFWKPAAFPTREQLDKIAPNNPLYLIRADGHGVVVNSAALKIAGITKETESPFGGEIMKDKESGEPNGMLLDRAHDLVAKHLPAITQADLEQALILGSKRSIELGWTQVHNAGVDWNEVDLMKKLYSERKIKLRVYEAIRGPGEAADRLLREGPNVGLFDNRLTIRTIKISFDGALGSKGAALLENYADHDTAGFLTYKPEQLLPTLKQALRKGVQIETHAIGDRANREILNLYEQAFEEVPPIERMERSDPRWRIEHAQIVHPDDIPRFKKLNIIPSMQPSHAIGDLHFAPSRVGLKRLEGAYAWQSFIKQGSIVPGGSDAPVERGEPMIEFYAAVARKDLKGFSGEGWHPEQKVTREQALKMFTIWPAMAAFQENLFGTITVGKIADLTVLSADIMQIPEAEILKTRNVMTIVNGEVVYETGK